MRNQLPTTNSLGNFSDDALKKELERRETAKTAIEMVKSAKDIDLTELIEFTKKTLKQITIDGNPTIPSNDLFELVVSALYGDGMTDQVAANFEKK